MYVKKPYRVYKEIIMLIKGGCDALNEVAKRQNADIDCECNANAEDYEYKRVAKS